MLSSGNLYGKCLAQRIPVHGPMGLSVQELLPHIPLRIVVRHNAIAEICGKALVEPEVLPIRRADQISEPLMGHLVGNDFTYPLLARL